MNLPKFLNFWPLTRFFEPELYKVYREAAQPPPARGDPTPPTKYEIVGTYPGKAMTRDMVREGLKRCNTMLVKDRDGGSQVYEVPKKGKEGKG